MLEGLDSVNWSKHKGAYHLKERVPILIREMTSQDDAVRRKASSSIFEEMHHQGSIYDATPYIIKFLIELLTYEQVQDKEDLILMIWHVLAACEETYGDTANFGIRATRGYILTYDYVEAGFYTFANLLDDENLTIRLTAILIISHLKEHAAACRHMLRRKYCAETDPLIKAVILKCLAGLVFNGYGSAIAHSRKKYMRLFESVLQVETEPVIRLGAALAWANSNAYYPHNDRLFAPQAVRDELIKGLKYAAPGGNIGWVVNSQLSFDTVMNALIGLGWKEVAGILDTSPLDRFDAHRLIRTILDIGFTRKSTRSNRGYSKDYVWVWWEFEETHLSKSPETMTYRMLPNVHAYDPATHKLNTPRQKEILAAIVKCDVFWELPTNLFSFFYGLPDSRDELARLVEANK